MGRPRGTSEPTGPSARGHARSGRRGDTHARDGGDHRRGARGRCSGGADPARRRPGGTSAHPARFGGAGGSARPARRRRHVAARAVGRLDRAHHLHVRYHRRTQGCPPVASSHRRGARRSGRGVAMDLRRHARPRAAAVPRARSGARRARRAAHRFPPGPHRPSDRRGVCGCAGQPVLRRADGLGAGVRRAVVGCRAAVGAIARLGKRPVAGAACSISCARSPGTPRSSGTG